MLGGAATVSGMGWWWRALTGAGGRSCWGLDSAIRDSPLSSSPARLRRHAQGQQMSCARKAPDGWESCAWGPGHTRTCGLLPGGRRSRSETGGPCPRGGSPARQAVSCSCCHVIPQLSADPCLSRQLEHLGMKAGLPLGSEQPLPRWVPFHPPSGRLCPSAHVPMATGFVHIIGVVLCGALEILRQ